MGLESITKDSTMEEILRAYPGAQQALFARYHIGGCSSCGFEPHETLEQVARKHQVTNIQEVLQYLGETAALEQKAQVAPAELKTLLAAGNGVKVLDMRSPQEHAVAQIAGALLVTDELAHEVVTTWPKDTPLVLFCHLGEQSLQAVHYLSSRGFTNVKCLRGGIDAWSLEVDSKVPRYEAHRGHCK